MQLRKFAPAVNGELAWMLPAFTLCNAEPHRSGKTVFSKDFFIASTNIIYNFFHRFFAPYYASFEEGVCENP